VTDSGSSVVVPFFVSHQGCPHACVFCDQRKISGARGDLPSPEDIRERVRRYRETSDSSRVEAAFYGGSFTLLTHQQQRALLAPLQPLLDNGEITAVRVSTRPDAIDHVTVRLLTEMRVGLVELGVQSMDDGVLAASGRGHTSADTVRAFSLLHDAGIAAGGQLMPWLPEDTPAKALRSLHDLLALRPACLRIYPTVVLEGTELADRYRQGDYQPLPLADTVSLLARMLPAAYRSGVPVIRIGLQATDALSGPAGVIAGPYHPALRSLVEAELYGDLILHMAGEATGSLTVAAHPSRRSGVSGPNGVNRVRLRARGIVLRKVLPDETLSPHDLAVTIAGVTRKGNIMTDLKYPGPEACHA
jgi:histone acetyltransferase (RNA polymerase elongator complex component)